MKFSPVLTIAIPTFNRVDCLRLLVESVMKQIHGDSQEILGIKLEILVCNNASTDGTAIYLQELADIPGITIHHHGTNCGSDLNIISCCQLALGKYVWVMGDDDFPMVGTLRILIDFLISENPDLVYLPARWEEGDLTRFIDKKPLSTEIVQVTNKGLAVRSNIYVTFISSWIMNMEKYREVATSDYCRFAGTSLAQLEWIFSLLLHGERFFLGREELIFARAGNSGGYTVFDVFSKNFNRIVDHFFASTPDLGNFFRRSMLWCFIPGLIWGVRKNTIGKFGKFDSEKIMTVLRAEYSGELFFRWLVIPILRANNRNARYFWMVTRAISKTWLFLQRRFNN
ncbi:glycosyltransferase family 2 protein [Janthinobacterium sp. RB2R34]|uniref:glycosyltransferase family 2 protein n=1 Tax=Janthinobacterium sp. RB2R34 TaxID=3424193 RepID=UPI003F257CAE